jgi:hypothetical protein
VFDLSTAWIEIGAKELMSRVPDFASRNTVQNTIKYRIRPIHFLLAYDQIKTV